MADRLTEQDGTRAFAEEEDARARCTAGGDEELGRLRGRARCERPSDGRLQSSDASSVQRMRPRHLAQRERSDARPAGETCSQEWPRVHVLAVLKRDECVHTLGLLVDNIYVTTWWVHDRIQLGSLLQ